MTPVLVTPPSGSVVELAAMKAHLRVDHADEDTLISTYTSAAVAHLDGWRGVLGRAILPQTWAVTVEDAGDYVLPMTDVTAASADYGAGAVALVVAPTAAGPQVTVTAAATITFTCAMPARDLDRVRVIIKLMVGDLYQNREGRFVGTIQTDNPAVASLIAALRWMRL